MSTDQNNYLLESIPNGNLETLSSAVLRVNNYSSQGESLGTGFITTLEQLGFTESIEMSYMDGIYGISAVEKKITVGINRPLVLTNAHVIEGADRVTVETHNKVHMEVITLLCETQFDLGLLYIKDISKVKNKLNIIPMGDSSHVATGSEACAIGMPHGQDFTYTIGTISHVNAEASGISLIPAFQTDTEINPGNSGGPLLSLAVDEEDQLVAQIIGINTFIFTQDGFSNTGINFALRINEVCNILYHFISEQTSYAGKATGFEARPLIGFDQEAYGLESLAGFLITNIDKTSPFNNVLQKRDVVIAIDAKPTARVFDFLSYAFLRIDDPFKLTIVRQGEPMTIDTVWEKEHVKLTHLINPTKKVFFADFTESVNGEVVLLASDGSSRLYQAHIGTDCVMAEVESAEERYKMIKVQNLEHFYGLCSAHGENFYQISVRFPNHIKTTPLSLANDFVD